MTPPVFYAPRGALLDADRLLLDGPEGRHAALVRRLRIGERLDLTDGAGLLAEGVVAAVGKDTLEIDLTGRQQLPAPRPRIVVVQALAKGDRAEAAVESMVEVGVDVIVPWAASRSIARWSGKADRADKGLAKWRATAREAAKQSRRFWWPEVAELASTRDVATLLGRAALPLVAHESARAPLTALTPPEDGDVVLVVGPEGGVSDDELATFAAAGATSCRLGPTVLRTSTAGTVAAAVLLARTPRW
jgi:16S rRNA (uracil1498-N3)-methyltransferase